MYDALEMRVLHCPRDLDHKPNDPTRVITKTWCGVQQTTSRSKFHGEKRQAVFGFAHLVDGEDVWMIKTRRRLGFATKTSKCFTRISVKAQDALQGNDPARISLARAIDDAHSAAPDFLQNLIIAEAPTSFRKIDLFKHVLQGFCGFNLALEPLIERTTQTKSAHNVCCRFAFLARHNIRADSH